MKNKSLDSKYDFLKHMEGIPSTSTCCFDIRITRQITKGDMINLCLDLGRQFNKRYNSKEYSFQPEPITEGGIMFTSFPGKDPWNIKYKTMRIRFNSHWPWIDEDVMQAWSGSDDMLVQPSDFPRGMETYLKAFNGAPPWTQTELGIFEQCFNKIGGFRKGRITGKKRLVSRKLTPWCSAPRDFRRHGVPEDVLKAVFKHAYEPPRE